LKSQTSEHEQARQIQHQGDITAFEVHRSSDTFDPVRERTKRFDDDLALPFELLNCDRNVAVACPRDKDRDLDLRADLRLLAPTKAEREQSRAAKPEQIPQLEKWDD